jgi:hypothetical protein
MSPAERGARDKEFSSLKADWVGKVVRDPTKPADALTLSGYLGDSATPEHLRLYFEVELATWVDIPVAAMLHAQRLPEEASPLGEVMVWIRRDAQLIHGGGGAQQTGTFFEGPIFQEQYAAALGAGAGPFGGGFPPGGFFSVPPQCPPFTPKCPSFLPVQCPISVGTPRCPISYFAPQCPTRVGPVCPTQGVPRCPISLLPVQCPRTPGRPCITITVPLNCQSKLICGTQNIVCQTAGVPCQSLQCTGFCPSAIDACPSAPGGCDPWGGVGGVINPGGFFGGGFGG